MQNLNDEYLLMIEPEAITVSDKIDDKYSSMVRLVLENAKIGNRYRGWHTCKCGAKSGSSDLIYKGYITNSLALHYTQEHRSEVPQSELDKLDKLFPDFIMSEPSSEIKKFKP